MVSNPFTPTFGVSPPLLVGREDELASFREALEEGPGSPGRAMLFTGARGSGKTVMLNEVEDLARRHGWLVVSETTRPGVAEHLAQTVLPGLLAEHVSGAVRSRVTGAQVAAAGFGAGVSTEREQRYPQAASLRSQLEALTEALAVHQSGVLVSLDEVHTAAMQDLRLIAHAV